MEKKHIQPADIESTSMSIITQELADAGIILPEENAPVIRRVIHTSADFDYADNLQFSENAVARGIASLKEGAVIITDTNMALAGVSKPSLKTLGAEAYCFMAEPEIAAKAKADGTTRAVASMCYAAQKYPQAIFAIGNAPTALLKLSELMESGLRPSLIIAVPVGFVNVVESKEEVFAVCEKYDVPCIVAMGRKGGSNVAAAICNALLYEATGKTDPSKRWK